MFEVLKWVNCGLVLHAHFIQPPKLYPSLRPIASQVRLFTSRFCRNQTGSEVLDKYAILRDAMKRILSAVKISTGKLLGRKLFKCTS